MFCREMGGMPHDYDLVIGATADDDTALCMKAYKKLTSTDFFKLLDDLETGLYLEPDAYLCEACLLELEKGPEAMYEFIGRE